MKYIEEGRGGWIGFHHATLLGEFDGYPMWDWFSGFMGDIRFKDYIPGKAAGLVNVEDSGHPIMKNVPASFIVTEDEWYTLIKIPGLTCMCWPPWMNHPISPVHLLRWEIIRLYGPMKI